MTTQSFPAFAHALWPSPLSFLLLMALVACGHQPAQVSSEAHLNSSRLGRPDGDEIPMPIQGLLSLPRPTSAAAPIETFSVVVDKIAVNEFLFALARNARMNVDIHPAIAGVVSLNAIDQTLPQLLERIARQVQIRWEISDNSLTVLPDTPFLKTYPIDYVNMSRDTSGSVYVTTQITSTGPGITPNSASNNSLTRIVNTAQNRFWQTLIGNIEAILAESDAPLPPRPSESSVNMPVSKTASQPDSGETESASASSPEPAITVARNTPVSTVQPSPRQATAVIANPESGILAVRASARQHQKVQRFIEQIMAAARRQVLIEATIAEVTLASGYQRGIDWSRLRADASASGFSLQHNGLTLNGPGLFSLGVRHVSSSGGVFAATLKLLENYGSVRVLSSPKLSVLNNQSAILKVVDNLAYFTIKADTETNNNSTTTSYTTNLYSVPVGLVMNIMPQISAGESILLNIRPSISRQYGTVLDPHPELQRVGIKNEIPLIRTREMESVLRVTNGDIAVMGGLMEDSLEDDNQRVPGLANVPMVGGLFQNRSDSRSKTELVVFLRPVIINDASVDGDYAEYLRYLPAADFFANRGPQQPSVPTLSSDNPF